MSRRIQNDYGRLNDPAKVLCLMGMFIGRVDPVSLAMSLTAKPDDTKRRILPVMFPDSMWKFA